MGESAQATTGGNSWLGAESTPSAYFLFDPPFNVPATVSPGPVLFLVRCSLSLFVCFLSFSAMAKIQEEVKLDFKDVLIRPKRSTLKSRSQVSLERTIKMKHSKQELTCVPIIAAK
jgi:hypothetical protein